MQQTTAVTTLQTGAQAKHQSRHSVFFAARLGAATLTGCLAVLGPWAADTLVGRALAAKVSRTLSARTGMSVKIARIRPLGLLSAGFSSLGLVANNIQMIDGELSMTAGQVTFTRSLSGSQITILSASVTGTDQGVEQFLRRAEKWFGRRKAKNRRSVGPLKWLLARPRVILVEGKAALQLGKIPSQRILVAIDRLRWDKDERGSMVKASLDALIETPGMWLSARIDHMHVRPEGLTGWKNVGQRSAATTLYRMLQSKRVPTLDWIDEMQGKVSIHLSRATAGRYLQCGQSCRTSTIMGTFKIETLAKGLTNAKISLTDDQGLARFHALASRDRIEDKWHIQTVFHDIPARALGSFLPTIHVTQGRTDGRADFISQGKRLKGKLSLHFDGNLSIRNRLVATKPISWMGVGLDILLSVTKRQTGWTAIIQDSRVTSKNMRLGIQGRIRLRADRTWQADLTARLARRPCQDLLDALPGSLVPVLEGMQLEGTIGAKLHFRADSRNMERLAADMKTWGRCSVLRDPPKADSHKLLRNSVIIRIRNAVGREARLTLGPSNPFYRPLRSLPAHLIRAFLLTEDRRFFAHHGFDWDQIRRALALNLRQHAVLKGASSISQQVVKNLYLNHHRTFSRKLQEAVLTWRMEQVVPKRRILELYLNLVEMGPGIYGVEQAARTYFHKPAKRLTPLQSMHLASITPAPRRYYRVFKQRGRVGTAWLARLRHRLRWMYQFGWISEPDYENIKDRGLFLAAF